MTYIGAGMICSHLVNLSLLFGAVLSWGIMWPLIRGLKGEWFPETLSESSMKSLSGYKVWVLDLLRLLLKQNPKLYGRVIVNMTNPVLYLLMCVAGFYFHRNDPWGWALQFSQDTIFHL